MPGSRRNATPVTYCGQLFTEDDGDCLGMHVMQADNERVDFDAGVSTFGGFDAGAYVKFQCSVVRSSTCISTGLETRVAILPIRPWVPR